MARFYVEREWETQELIELEKVIEDVQTKITNHIRGIINDFNGKTAVENSDMKGLEEEIERLVIDAHVKLSYLDARYRHVLMMQRSENNI
jgi:hypothetical protein